MEENEAEARTINISFKDFLVLSMSKDSQKPEVFGFRGGSVDMRDKLTFSNRPLHDSLVLCNATLDLSSAKIDLTKTDIAA